MDVVYIWNLVCRCHLISFVLCLVVRWWCWRCCWEDMLALVGNSDRDGLILNLMSDQLQPTLTFATFLLKNFFVTRSLTLYPVVTTQAGLKVVIKLLVEVAAANKAKKRGDMGYSI